MLFYKMNTVRENGLKKEVLEVEFRGLSTDRLLEMSVDDAIAFFEK